MNRTFQDIIHTALKTPNADYGVREEVNTIPIGEIGQPWAIRAIEKRSPQPSDQHVVMGFGGLFTFDLATASASSPAGILLCDINSEQSSFWEAFLQLVKESETAKTLQDRFSALPAERKDIRFFKPQMVEAAKSKRNNWGEVKLEWMYDEDKYQKVRQMVLEGKVAHITLDALDKDRYAVLKKTFVDNELSMSALYLSNIHRFFQDEEEKSDFFSRKLGMTKQETSRIFWENQLSLCHDQTLIMNAEPDRNFPQDYINTYTPQECRQKFGSGRTT